MTVKTMDPTTSVRDIMTPDPVSIGSGDSVAEAARTLDSNDISGLPVVDVQDRVIGVVSRTDLVHRYLQGPGDGTDNRPSWTSFHEGFGDAFAEDAFGTVEEIMTPDPITVGPDDPISQIAALMVEHRVHRLLVIDSSRHIMGVVTSMDLIEATYSTRKTS